MKRITEALGALKARLRHKLLRAKLNEGWIGVTVEAEDMRVAHVRRSPGGRPEVLVVHTESRLAGDASALRNLGRNQGLTQCRCNLLLNPSEYQVLQIELPAVPQEELKEAVRWQIKDLVHLPIETATVDVLEIPGIAGRAARTRHGLAVAADDGPVGGYMELFADADATLEAIDIPELALRNVSTLFEEPGRGLAMLSLVDDRATLTFTFEGELYAVRQIDMALVKLEAADGDWLQQLLDRVGLEVQRSLDNFERLHGHITVARLLLSPLPTMPALLSYLREYLSLPVAELDLNEVLDLTLVPELRQPARQAHYLKAIGAALRTRHNGVAL